MPTLSHAASTDPVAAQLDALLPLSAALARVIRAETLAIRER